MNEKIIALIIVLALLALLVWKGDWPPVLTFFLAFGVTGAFVIELIKDKISETRSKKRRFKDRMEAEKRIEEGKALRLQEEREYQEYKKKHTH